MKVFLWIECYSVTKDDMYSSDTNTQLKENEISFPKLSYTARP